MASAASEETSRPLAGCATTAGTREYIEEARRRGVTYSPDAVRSLGRTGFVVAKIGYGAARVHADVEEHVRSLLYALLHGCNVIDTSVNAMDGGSQRLVGNVLRALVESEGLRREQVVIVSKIGAVRGSNVELVTQREEEGDPFPEMVSCVDGFRHCIHPAWLENQLDLSLDRLELACLDVLLLDEPETFLTDANERRPRSDLSAVRAEFYDRISRAFERMERFASEGRVSYYGVSCSTFAVPREHPEHVSLTALIDAARRAAESVHGDADAHRFAVAELPFNLIEAGAFAEENAPDGRSFLEVAAEHEIGVLTGRPINAFTGTRLLRLAQYAYDERAGDPLHVFARVAATERDLVLALKRWHLWNHAKNTAPTRIFFNVGETMKRAFPEIEGREGWLQVFEHVIAPSVIAYTQHVGDSIPGERRNEWKRELHAYQRVLRELVSVVTSHFNRHETEEKAPLRAALVDALGEEASQLTLSQIAMNTIASVPGVSVVLCGMKRDAYAQEGTALLSVPAFSDPFAAIRAAAKASLVD